MGGGTALLQFHPPYFTIPGSHNHITLIDSRRCFNDSVTDLVTVKNISCFSIQKINVAGTVAVQNPSATIGIIYTYRGRPGIGRFVFPDYFTCAFINTSQNTLCLSVGSCHSYINEIRQLFLGQGQWWTGHRRKHHHRKRIHRISAR